MKTIKLIIVICVACLAMVVCSAETAEEEKVEVRKSIGWIGYSGHSWQYDQNHEAIDISDIGVYVGGTFVRKDVAEICKANGFAGIFILEDTDSIYAVKHKNGMEWYDYYCPTEDPIFEVQDP